MYMYNVFKYTNIDMHVHTHTLMHTYIRINMHTNTYTHKMQLQERLKAFKNSEETQIVLKELIGARERKRVHALAESCKFICIYVYVHVFVCVCVCVCVCVYIYILCMCA